jgi:hypothetical protein
LRGRVREGGNFACRRNDHFQNGIPIFQNIGIPEAENTIAPRREPTISLYVFGGFGMLSAIDLHNELVVMADEINDEASNRGLTPET